MGHGACPGNLASRETEALTDCQDCRERKGTGESREHRDRWD